MGKLTVLDPMVPGDAEGAALAPHLASLRGARIAFVDNSKVNADVFLGRVKPLLEKVYGAKPGETVRKLAPKDELTAADIAKLKQYDAVIQCFGD
jgi:hypothetical protein